MIFLANENFPVAGIRLLRDAIQNVVTEIVGFHSLLGGAKKC